MATGEAGEVGGVSLRSPRPAAARTRNEYVETPLHRPENNNKKVGSGESTGVLTRQPTTGGGGGGKKGGGGASGGGGGGGGAAARGGAPPPCSIICPRCGKCRCDACRSPRRPPSVWLCSDFCLCSVDSCVDYASCLCCVKGLMYHWSSGGEDAGWADDPCSCSPTRWLRRWTCLALTSLCLPCLCCYCPLRTCADGCERGYAACSNRGCSCRPDL